MKESTLNLRDITAVAGVILLISTAAIIAICPEPANAQFVLSGGLQQYDQYGQGIMRVKVYENSSGSWVQVGGYYYTNESHTIEWPANVAIKLYIDTWFNSTLTGATQPEGDALNLMRHNVTVRVSVTHAFVWSQANFTYDSLLSGQGQMWCHRYYVVLNFLPSYMMMYVIGITYEVFY